MLAQVLKHTPTEHEPLLIDVDLLSCGSKDLFKANLFVELYLNSVLLPSAEFVGQRSELLNKQEACFVQGNSRRCDLLKAPRTMERILQGGRFLVQTEETLSAFITCWMPGELVAHALAVCASIAAPASLAPETSVERAEGGANLATEAT